MTPWTTSTTPTRSVTIPKWPGKYRGPRLARYPRHMRRWKKSVHRMGRLLTGCMNSPSRPWFSLTIEDDHLQAQPGVREWMDTIRRSMQDEIKPLQFYLDSAIP